MSLLAVITPPGGPEWIIILVIFVLLFGAKKLPELGSSVGKSIKNFKRGIDEEQARDDAEQATAEAGPGQLGPPSAPTRPSADEASDARPPQER